MRIISLYLCHQGKDAHMAYQSIALLAARSADTVIILVMRV